MKIYTSAEELFVGKIVDHDQLQGGTWSGQLVQKYTFSDGTWVKLYGLEVTENSLYPDYPDDDEEVSEGSLGDPAIAWFLGMAN